MNTVLVVDDKEMMRDSVGSTLQRAGFSVVTADGGEQALVAIAARRPDAVVTDLRMPGLSGLDLLDRIRQIDDELPVVVMTAFAAVETAVKAIKLGAFDYITKPFEGDELVIAVKRAIQHAGVVKENALLRIAVGCDSVQGNEFAATCAGGGAAEAVRGLDRIIGRSPAIRRVKEQVMAVAESQGTVMICGESGAGKEVIARAIHDISPRGAAPFLAVNCAALSEALLESELFGHERGAFTGAERLRKGRFELADHGTLLLDEVSEISPQLQAKLLRVLQERAFERVGSSTTIGVDVRIVATSNRDLPQAVAKGEFRQDLFFRLNVLPIHLPPLRDRLEDVPPLAEHFIRGFCRREGRPETMLSPEAMELMQTYSWPGNVRELQNICERAVVLTTSRVRSGDVRPIGRETIEPWLGCGLGLRMPSSAGISGGFPEPTSLPGGFSTHGSNGVAGGYIEPKHDRNGSFPGAAVPGSMLQGNGAIKPLEDMEREAIIYALRKFNGHRQKTAIALGIGVRTLGLKLKKWKEEKLVAESL